MCPQICITILLSSRVHEDVASKAITDSFETLFLILVETCTNRHKDKNVSPNSQSCAKAFSEMRKRRAIESDLRRLR